MRIRCLLAATIAAALCLGSSGRPLAQESEFGIGSTAPALDIEHWIQDGNGFFKPVTEFQQDKVYVVEFWATWCAPCIQMMPHLAELQTKYRDQNVQIISVSDESIEEVKDLLSRSNEQLGKTFAEITSAYSLTTDPDGSTYRDYMDAARQETIPKSFLVGKTGVIEWLGHPLDLDEPLAKVVDGTWDREEFKKNMALKQEFERAMKMVASMAGAGRFAEAIKFVDEQKLATKDSPLNAQWNAISNRLKLSGDLLDDDAITFFREQLTSMKGDAYAVGNFAFMILSESRQGNNVGPLAAEGLTAAKTEVEVAAAELKPLLYNVIALLTEERGDLQGAIEAQQAAVDSATDPRVKSRMTPKLEELKRKAAEASGETQPESEAEAK